MSGTMLEPAAHDPSYVHLPSRFIDVRELAWQPTTFPGIDIKVLLDDPESGLPTARSAPAISSVVLPAAGTSRAHQRVR